jgi:putative photosynthetic complex assembly protein 2
MSFMNRRRMNWLMPFSILGGAFLVAVLARRAGEAGTTPFQLAGLTCVITLLALAVLEHALLVLPLPFTALWGFWLRHTPGVSRCEVPALEEQAEVPAWPRATAESPV